jgi:hypothetical protein
VFAPAAVAVGPHDVAPDATTAALRPPLKQLRPTLGPAGCGGQGGEEAVDADDVGEPLVVGDGQVLSRR